MPKMKTHRGAAKRFKVTGTGKIRRRKAFRAHLLEKKSSQRTRRLGRAAEVTGGDKKHVERMLGALIDPVHGRHVAGGASHDGQGQAIRPRQEAPPQRSSRRPRGTPASRSRSFRKANEQVMHSRHYAYRDRRARKGEFRRLWIVRINAACRAARHLATRASSRA